jgi:hypothetical protein
MATEYDRPAAGFASNANLMTHASKVPTPETPRRDEDAAGTQDRVGGDLNQ